MGIKPKARTRIGSPTSCTGSSHRPVGRENGREGEWEGGRGGDLISFFMMVHS